MREIKHVHETLENILAKHKKVLLAVSGGVDSIALLHLCLEAKRDDTLLQVAHVNHGVRSQSLSDAEFVGNLAKALGLKFHLLNLPQIPHGVNFESWSRDQRYLWFKTLCFEEGLNYTYTAHTADDVIETMLMRLVSNKEPRGILECDDVRQLFRPLLYCHKKTLQDYVKKENLAFAHDQTNDDNQFLRNKVRNQLIPQFTELFGEQVESALAERAHRLAYDLQLLDGLAIERLGEVETHPWGSRDWLRTLAKACKRAPGSLAVRILQQALKPQIGYNLGISKAEEVLNMLQGNSIAVQLPGNLSIRRFQGGWVLEPSSNT